MFAGRRQPRACRPSPRNPSRWWWPTCACPEWAAPSSCRRSWPATPATVRLLLAADADREAALQGLARAHQFLAKPCNLRYLKSILEFASAQGRRVGNDHVRELVPASASCRRCRTCTGRSPTSWNPTGVRSEQLGAVIGQDIGHDRHDPETGQFRLLQPPPAGDQRRPRRSSYLGVDLLKALVLAHGLFGQVGAIPDPRPSPSSTCGSTAWRWRRPAGASPWPRTPGCAAPTSSSPPACCTTSAS